MYVFEIIIALLLDREVRLARVKSGWWHFAPTAPSATPPFRGMDLQTLTPEADAADPS